jgi:hypothetical protein
MIRAAALALDEYRARRAEALEARLTFLGKKTGRAQLAMEDSLGAATEARFWMFELKRRLASAVVVPFGGRLSPAAMARRASR